MPGIYTPTEAVAAMECGADVLKVFPGDIAGPRFIKDIHGPIPNAVMMPSGGVDVDNVKDWIKAGAIACGAGSSLIAGARQATMTKSPKQAKSLFRESKRQEPKWQNNQTKHTQKPSLGNIPRGGFVINRN